MPVENNIIKAPINPADVYKLLGVGERPDGWNNGYIVSDQENKVNPFSRKKPVKADGVNINFTNPDKWFRSSNKNCGFIIEPLTSLSEVKTVRWAYDPPRGTSPKRLADFLGYNHRETVFIEYKNMEVNVAASTKGFTISAFYPADEQLQFKDFEEGTLAETWITSCIRYNGTYYIKSAEESFINGGIVIPWTWDEFIGAANSVGKYEVYMVLSRTQHLPRTILNDIVNRSIYNLPQITGNPFTLSVIRVSTFGLRILRMGRDSTGLRETAYYKVDFSKLDYDQQGKPIYSGTNYLRSTGRAYLELEVYNNLESSQNVNLSTPYFIADNFRQMMSGRCATILWEDENLTRKVTTVNLPAKGTKKLYADDNYFARLKNGDAFIPEDGDTIAPGNLTFYAGYSTGSIGSAIGLVIKNG